MDTKDKTKQKKKLQKYISNILNNFHILIYLSSLITVLYDTQQGMQYMICISKTGSEDLCCSNWR